jgi:hypothetical protein
MRHILTADLLEGMRECLRNLENLKLLSPDDLHFLELRRDLKEGTAVVERQNHSEKRDTMRWQQPLSRRAPAPSRQLAGRRTNHLC